VKFKPHPYQADAVKFMLANKSAGIFADPGLGKTATTLQYIRTRKLLNPNETTLIVAPLRVVYSVWQQEIQKWDNFQHLTSTKLHGARKGSKLERDRDIYLINPEGLNWLLDKKVNFDNLIIDESSKFKSPKAKRFKLLKKHLDRFDRRYILTGTPTPKSLEDLWSQVYILDKGDALGKYITHYRNIYFNRTGFQNFIRYELKPGADDVIYRKVAPLVMRIDAKTHLDLPELVVNEIPVKMSPTAKKVYDGLKSQLCAEIEGNMHFVPSASGAYLACCQVANGALYEQEMQGFDVKTLSTFKELHKAKVDALADLVDELQGKPVLVAYRFRHDLARLVARFGAKTPHIGGDTTARESARIVERWNRGKIPLLLGNPQSMAHGLNLQGGGNDVVWFGLTDNYEDYTQFNGRVYRQGVGGQVRVHHIITQGTVDRVMLRRCRDKEARQESLFEALKNYIKE
jgi:SNF2 family DNA or RNA helicase